MKTQKQMPKMLKVKFLLIATSIIMLSFISSCTVRVPTVVLDDGRDRTPPRIELHVIDYDLRDAYNDPGADQKIMIPGRAAAFEVPSRLTNIGFIADAFDRDSGVRISTMTIGLVYRCSGGSAAIPVSLTESSPSTDPGPAVAGDEVSCGRITSQNIKLSTYNALCQEAGTGNASAVRGTITITATNYKGEESSQEYNFTVTLNTEMM